MKLREGQDYGELNADMTPRKTAPDSSVVRKSDGKPDRKPAGFGGKAKTGKPGKPGKPNKTGKSGKAGKPDKRDRPGKPEGSKPAKPASKKAGGKQGAGHLKRMTRP